MKFLLGLVAILVLVVYSVCLSGWAFSLLWGWFIVPVFGAPMLLVSQAIGISLVVTYLTHHDRVSSKKKEGETFTSVMIEIILTATIKPLFAVGMGWLITLFL